MYRFLKIIYPKSKISHAYILPKQQYSTYKLFNARNILISISTLSLSGIGGILAYSKYDPNFKKFLEKNVPYSELIFNSSPDFQKNESIILSDNEITVKDASFQKTICVPDEFQSIGNTTNDDTELELSAVDTKNCDIKFEQSGISALNCDIELEQNVSNTQSDINHDQSLPNIQENTELEQSVTSTQDDIELELSVTSTQDNTELELSVASTQDNTELEQSVACTQDNTELEQSVENTQDYTELVQSVADIQNDDIKLKQSLANNQNDDIELEQSSVNGSEYIKNNELVLTSLLTRLSEVTADVDYTQSLAMGAIHNYLQKLYEVSNNYDESIDVVWTDAYDVQISILKYLEEKISTLKETSNQLEKEMTRLQKDDEISNTLLYSIQANIDQARGFTESVEENIRYFEITTKNISDYKTIIDKAKKYVKKENEFPYHQNDVDYVENVISHLIDIVREGINNACQETSNMQLINEDKNDPNFSEEDVQNFKTQIEIGKRINEKVLRQKFKKEVNMLREALESEFRKQLGFQLTLHLEHLQESLQAQQDQLNLKHTDLMDENLLKQRNDFCLGNVERLNKIEAYLKKSSDVIHKFYKANELWLLCDDIKTKLEMWPSTDHISIKNELKLLHHVASSDNEFVITLLAGIPSEINKRGVCNIESLKKRFKEVKRLGRRVAMIDENNQSLYQYMLSYFQSFLIVDPPFKPNSEVDEIKSTDDSVWNTFEILNGVDYCLQKNDLERAFQYANLLKGEPRNVADDWILDVRLLLELRQAINCLIAYSSAIAIQSYH